jgi:hypothetical protein
MITEASTTIKRLLLEWLLLKPRNSPRHCERSEAIHRAAKKAWIASSLRSSQ